MNGDGDIDVLHSAKTQFISRPTRTADTPISIHITEFLHPSHPRTRPPQGDAAKIKNKCDLIRRGAWKIVIEQEVPPHASIMTGRFVITIKGIETDIPRFKARYVVKGHKDMGKSELVHNSRIVCQGSTRLITSLAAIFGSRIWSHVSQACLKSASELVRDIYPKGSKEFLLPSNQLLKLLRPLYRLADSADYLNMTFGQRIKT